MKVTMKEFSQEMHCCGSQDDEATLTLQIMDGGGGGYIVLTADQFSFDSESEIDELAAEMKAMLNPAS